MARLSHILIALVLTFGVVGTVYAESGPSDDEIRTMTQKYVEAFEAKGSGANVFNAKRILKWMNGEDPQMQQAARGMYMGYKAEWDKELGWEETKSQKHLTEMQASLDAVADAGMPTDNESFATISHGWSKLVGDAAYHLKTYCAEEKDDTCPKAEELRKQALAKLSEVYNHGLATAAIEYDALQDGVFDSQWDEDRKGIVDVDKAVPQLAEEKLAYWRDKLKGGMEQEVSDTGSAMCQTISGPGGAKLDVSKLKQLYGPKDKVLVRCTFAGPPTSFKRDAKDYWRVRIYWAGRWEDLALIYEIARPSAKPTVEFTVPMSAVIGKINDKAKEGGFLYPGNWLRVQIGYVTPYIDRWEWQDGKKVPIYKHGEVSATTFFARWK